ncbi:hypothetical protein [Streptomyces sp. NPDC058045]|uniref:hypothetical protein n=1 Tax=Streptomyces sp. NPDC058045 TaxID=3346311 RepID=UPI0036F00DFF
MHLDTVLPDWHYHERHQIAVAAPTATVMSAVDELTWREVPVFRGLLALRGLAGGTRTDSRVMDQFTDMGYTELARSEDELVSGLICSPWMGPPLALGETPTEKFRSFETAKHIKIAVNFRCADGLLTSETRVYATDAPSRKRFGLYWFAIRVGSEIIRRVWLGAVRRRAEAVVKAQAETEAEAAKG